MPEEVTFRRSGNVVLAVGWLAALAGPGFAGLGEYNDLTGRAAVGIGLFAVLIVGFALSAFAVAYLPCPRLCQDERVIENIFSRVRLPWAMVVGVERGLDLRLRSTNLFERYRARGGFAICDRGGGIHHVGAFRYGIAPVSPKSRLLTRAEAAVLRHRVAAEPACMVVVEPTWGRISLVAVEPALLAVLTGAAFVLAR